MLPMQNNDIVQSYPYHLSLRHIFHHHQPLVSTFTLQRGMELLIQSTQQLPEILTAAMIVSYDVNANFRNA